MPHRISTNMRKCFLLVLFAFAAVCSHAQTDSVSTAAVPVAPVVQPLKYGYFSYENAFLSMPEHATVKAKMAELTAQYEAETKRVEKEFNTKYEQFLEGQKDFPQSILQKRQMELQELLDKNIKFKEESIRLLEAAERDAYRPLHDRLASVLAKIGAERGYAFILNTDDNACPFTNPLMGEDINDVVRAALQ